jgi:hypothetical protein
MLTSSFSLRVLCGAVHCLNDVVDQDADICEDTSSVTEA